MSTVIVPIVVIPLALVLSLLLQTRLTRRFDYRCATCGATFSLSPGAAVLAPHRMGGSKYVRCPSCGRRSWAQRTPKPPSPSA